jgi:4-hydroxythreonine-4-phosphate dehydrogenase
LIIADVTPVAVSMGDPAGIGPEIVAKAWGARSVLPPFVMIGDAAAVRAVWSGPVAVVETLEQGLAAFGRALPVLSTGETGVRTPGSPDEAGAGSALQALEMAVGLVRQGAASALVTGPVSKAALYAVGFTHPGQTEFVAERCGVTARNAVMMLAGPSLRVVPITGHVPLADVSRLMTCELIVAKGRATARGLQRSFGIAAPRLAFAGLNPHAGESGTIGREEIDAMVPAIAELRAEGIDASGPHAADTLFHPRARARYDAVLCPTHDQALIPLKTIHFDEGVNVTLGLPIVRTSPDHGTAFDIAGKDVAEPGAMIAAIAMAGEMAGRRLG